MVGSQGVIGTVSLYWDYFLSYQTDVKKVVILDGAAPVSLAHTMPGRMNPGWSGARVPPDKAASRGCEVENSP